MARLEITAQSDAQGYWINVDKARVPMENGFGSIVVPPGRRLLYWGMFGKSGDTLSLEVTEGGVVLAKIVDDPIPGGWETGGGVQPIQVGAAAGARSATDDEALPTGWSIGAAARKGDAR